MLQTVGSEGAGGKQISSGNNAVFETICAYLEFYGRDMLLYVPPQRD